MEVLFIIIGIGILGYVAYAYKNQSKQGQPSEALQQTNHKQQVISKNENTYPSKPEAPSHKVIAYIIGGACLVLAPMALLSGFGILLCLVLAISGAVAISIGAKADERELKNVRARRQTTEEIALIEAARVKVENIRTEAQRQAELSRLRDIAERERIEVERLRRIQEQKDIEDRESFRPAAKEHGIDVNGVIAINMQRLTNLLDLEHKDALNRLEADKEWRQIEQDLRSGDRLLLSGNTQAKELYRELEEAVGKMVQVNQDKQTPEYAKRVLRKSLSSQIKSLSRQINEKQTGLLQAENGDKQRGTKKTKSNRRADYPPETDSDSDEL